MSNCYLLKLSCVDTCQLLDALTYRAEKWEICANAEFNDSKETSEDAAQIALHYRQIISSVEKQIEVQKSNS